VFTSPRGEPINPNTDYHHWKQLLVDAGLRDGRLHDARHTAATVLLILGVPERAVMSLMGWSTTAWRRGTSTSRVRSGATSHSGSGA
jgi:integrase